MLIGNRIKNLRKSKKLTLTELSQKSGVQIATLSRMENGKMTGTLESHLAIANALDLTLPQLYAEHPDGDVPGQVQEPKSSADVFVGSDKSSYEILTKQILSKKMMPVLLKVDVNGRTQPEEHPTGSEKFIYVLKGTLEVTVDKKKFELKAEHSLYFDASLEHTIRNRGKIAATALVIGTPVVL